MSSFRTAQVPTYEQIGTESSNSGEEKMELIFLQFPLPTWTSVLAFEMQTQSFEVPEPCRQQRSPSMSLTGGGHSLVVV